MVIRTTSKTKEKSKMHVQQQTRETLRERLTRFMRERAARAQAEAAQRKPLPSARALGIEDQRAIDAEIKAVEVRQADIARVLERAAPGSRASYEDQELRSEYARLHDLRQDIERDRANPITHDRDGRPLDAHWRMVRRHRAADLRASCWRQAERARAEGDHREARRWRLDALRSRHLAEHEFGWRPKLATYW
jgi:hypothetical protein